MKTIRVLLVEDNRILREGIAAMINGEADMKIVAASGGQDDILLQTHKLRPHMVLLDLGLRNHNGMRIVASLTKALPDIKVIGMGLIPTQLDIVDQIAIFSHNDEAS